MVFGEARPSKECAQARTTLLRALASGRLSALGVRPHNKQRVSIPALEWIDLRIEQRGLFDEVRDRDGLIAYREVRIAAESMRQLWPAETPAASLRPDNGLRAPIPGSQGIDLRIEQRWPNDEVRGVVNSILYPPMLEELPAETAAKKRAREKLDAERACFDALKRRMTERPNEPVTKKTLAREFPAISGRALDKCFTWAARETGAVAWTKAGRRQRSDSPESSDSARTEG